MKMIAQFSTLVLMLTAVSCTPRSSVNVSPQWELMHAPKEMCISLEIATYTGYPDRQKDCMIAVSKTRALGVDAYYYHGETTSSVCVGAWPMNAVDWQAAKAAMKPGGGMPRLKILDPSLINAIHNYPDFAINGYVHETEKDGVRKSAPSHIVFIPREGCDDPTQVEGHNILPHGFDLSR